MFILDMHLYVLFLIISTIVIRKRNKSCIIVIAIRKFFFMLLMTAIFFDNDENAYRRFGSLITQKNELVDTSWQLAGGSIR